MEKRLLKLPAKGFAKRVVGSLAVAFFRFALMAMIVPISLKER